MTLTQITKIRGPGIHTTSNIVSHNINSSGIITAVAFKGPFTGSSNIQSGILTATKIDLNGDIDVDGHTNLDNVNVAGVATFASAVNTGALTATTGTFSGNVSIGGTLTYEDVTNIDSVGIITARDGLKVLGGGANVVGVVTATSFVGGLPITSGADNRVITASSASAIQGESTLTYDGTTLQSLQSSGAANLTLKTSGNSFNSLKLDSNRTSANDNLSLIDGRWNGTVVSRIQFITGSDTSNKDDGYMAFHTRESGQNLDERLRITSGGDVGINVTPISGVTLQVGTPNSATGVMRGHPDYFSIDSGSSAGGGVVGSATNPALIFGGDGNTGLYHSASDTLNFTTGGTERLRIAADSNITQTIDTDGDGFIITAGTANIKPMLTGISNRGAVNNTIFGISGKWSSNEVGRIAFEAGADTTNKDDGHINFYTRVSGGSLTSRFHINSSGNLKIGTASAAGGRLYFESTSGAAQYIASGGTNNQDLIVASSAGEKLRISSAGRVLIATTTEGHGNADDLTIATAGGTLGHTGITIRSGTSNDGNIFFSDATSGTGETIGGIKYTHGGAGSNAETLNFIANGLTRATVSSTAFWVDDGTNARLKLAPDSATLNMIISTTTNNGSYCNLLYGAADHIFKYGGTETARLTTGGNYTITGEFASAQDYPTIKPTLDLNFAATKALDPRIEYYRYGPGSYIDANGKVVLVGEDVPRFDHDPDTGECKGLLVEGERRNYFPHGIRPGDKWTGAKANSTWTENTTETTAPDGTYTATKWAFTSHDPYLYHQQTLNAGVTYTMSVWVKAGTNMSGDVLQMRMGAAPYSTYANSTIPTDGSWKRLTFTKTIGGSNETNVNVGFEPQTNPSGNPASGDVIYIWGAQLESGTTASSLIPTYGYTQARGPDVVQITGEDFTDFYNQIEGTIFLSATYETDARAAAMVTIDDISAYANYTEVGYRSGGASSGQVASYIRTTAGNDQYYKNWSSSATQGNEFKIALGYKDDNYASSANGSTVHTDTSGTTHKTYDRLKFSEVHTVGHGGVGHYRRLMYYSKRITNSQLVTLTS